jgi:hypothetical protein
VELRDPSVLFRKAVNCDDALLSSIRAGMQNPTETARTRHINTSAISIMATPE